MQRYKITIEYDGSHFIGWQRQQNGISVQKAIESAILQFSGESVLVYGAGRTDAGVHAMGQVAHFDLAKSFSITTIKSAINHFVKPYIAIVHVEAADNNFHARFDAIKKQYIYQIVNRDSHLSLMSKRAWQLREKLDLSAMQAAAEVLVGRHNFTSFRAAACQANSPVKTLDSIQVDQTNDLIKIIFEGKSFLHNQVRIMSSAIKNVGAKYWTIEHLKYILAAKDRKIGPITAPAHGLYLVKIWYGGQ